jgi:hypothetical protein
MVDQCILSWIYNTVSKDVRAIVRVPKATAYTIWHSIHDQFRDNELHRAVYLEAEFRSLVQGDMDIATYTGRLKRLADALRDVGQPVQETSQVLNLLRGLSPKYRHTVPVISAKIPPTPSCLRVPICCSRSNTMRSTTSPLPNTLSLPPAVPSLQLQRAVPTAPRVPLHRTLAPTPAATPASTTAANIAVTTVATGGDVAAAATIPAEAAPTRAVSTASAHLS